LTFPRVEGRCIGTRPWHIGELFNTGSRFDASVSDPCSNAAPDVAGNCAALGVPPGFEAPNPQTSVTTGGNVDLTPETSDTFTAGLTWDVSAVDNWDSVDGLLFEFNYYDIEIEDAIQPPNAQDLLDQCVDTLDPFFCDAITRAPGGTITRIDGVLKNIGGIETSGFDWKMELMTADSGLGQFRFQWLNTHLIDYDEITEGPDGAVVAERAGTELGSPERGYVEWKSNFNIDWMMSDWSARLGFRYMDGLDEACGGLAADFEQFQLCSNGADGNRIGSTLFTDVQVTWMPDLSNAGQWSFTLGVDNLLDEDIPTCFSCDLNSFDGTLYPIPGPFWYFRSTFQID
jgi:iron complex outermembrane receptor protein